MSQGVEPPPAGAARPAPMRRHGRAAAVRARRGRRIGGTLPLVAGMMFAAACWAGGSEPGLSILEAAPLRDRRAPPPGSCWRLFQVARVPVVPAEGGSGFREETGANTWRNIGSQPPPPDWTEPDFDDRSWPRTTAMGSQEGWTATLTEYCVKTPVGALPCSPALARQCVRGRFRVPDPAAASGLHLAVAYRGGIVVHLNGREVARAHLPAGSLGDDALAEAYPPECFAQPAQRAVARDGRLRRFETEIPASLLRAGVNVLAIEARRAPYGSADLKLQGLNRSTAWATCGIGGIQLNAAAGVEPNRERPAGLQVWTALPAERLHEGSRGDPLEGPPALALIGARNGTFCGQIAIGSTQAIRGVRATSGDLRLAGGRGTIPARAVEIFYVVANDRLPVRRGQPPLLDILTPEPPDSVAASKSGAVLPVWVRVRVPRDAPPGRYEGAVTVGAEGLVPTSVPLRIAVADWTLPDPREFRTHVGLIQSPESLALYYGDALWSEEHWRRVETSFALLAELGNKTVYLPLIARTNFGNEQSMVRWIQDGDGYRHDFGIFDRYLDLALKHLKPATICLYAWDYESAGKGRSSGVPVTLWDPAAEESRELLAPKFDTPEARVFWAPVLDGVGARLRARGVEKAAMIGIIGEARLGMPVQVGPAMRAFFDAHLPGVGWVTHTHGGDSGLAAKGYFTQVYIRPFVTQYSWRPESYASRFAKAPDPTMVAWRRAAAQAWFCRGFDPLEPLADIRTLLERSFMHNLSGWGRVGADFWPVGIPRRAVGSAGNWYEKRTTSIAARYPQTDWNQLNIEHGGTLALLAPGPLGALRTVRFENLREGLQECEARIAIEAALLTPYARARLGEALAARCDALLAGRVEALKCGAGDAAQMAGELFGLAAETGARLQ